MRLKLTSIILTENKTIQSNYFPKLGMKTEDVFDLIEYQDYYKDLYPEYSEDREYGEDYYFKDRDTAYYEANSTLTFFNNLPDPIPVYRAIKVNNVGDIDLEWLGDSWSYSKQSAINFARNNNMGNILMSGKTSFDNVDWKETIKLYYQFSGGWDDSNEDEIRVISSSKEDIKDLKFFNIK